MKGKISNELRNILDDSDGRTQLRRALISNEESQIKVGRTTYRVYKTGSFTDRINELKLKTKNSDKK